MGYALIFSGLLFGFFFYLAIRRMQASQSWPSTEGTITGTSLSESYDDEGSLSGYVPHIHYEFKVAGETFTSKNYGLSENTMSLSKAQQFLEAFQTGQKVQVYYNPKHHGDAVLSVQSSKAVYFVVAACIVLVLVGFYITLFK